MFVCVCVCFCMYVCVLLIAQGSLKEDMSGLVSGLAEKAKKLKHNTEANDLPVIVVESDHG